MEINANIVVSNEGSGLPEGWAYPKLKKILNVNYGKGLKKSLRKHGTIPVFGSNGIVGGHDVPLTKGPTIIIGRKGSIGAVNFSSGPCWPIDTTYYVDEFSGLEPKYILFSLRVLKLGEYDTSTAIPGLNRNDLYDLNLSLPPVEEQRRIVAKVEELLGRVNSIRERLARVQVILKRFRQSVLSAACSGRLTADWREKHPDAEPAPELIRRIKEKRLESAKSARIFEQISNLYEGLEKKIAENNNEFNLPGKWLACEIKSIGTVCNGSTPSRKHPEFWGGDIPWVSSGEVRNNIINETKENISMKGYKNSSVGMLPEGTVLLAMIGEGKTRGQTAITKIETTINQNIAGVVIDHGFISSEYLWYWFQFQYEITRQVGSGTGPQALNCEMVRELPFNLPPLEEQNEIVRKVEELLKIANSIERRVAETRARVNKLFEAILTKAFRGELVPTEAELARREGRSYEPASSLLARIKAERDIASSPVSKKRRNRVSIKT